MGFRDTFSHDSLAMNRPSSAAVSYYDDMPFSLVLFRFLWPFWLFQDATRGDRYARAAAYRHNRDMRVYLPGYLMKWLLSCALGLALASGFDSLAHSIGGTNVLTVIAAACAMFFACGVCVMFVTAYIYLYLARNDL
jgi:hypothetical protein